MKPLKREKESCKYICKSIRKYFCKCLIFNV